MPKGYSWRKPHTFEMHATMVNIPEGADVLEYLIKAGEEAGYIPLIVLSGTGILERATFNIPNDDLLPELTESPNIFGVNTTMDEETRQKFEAQEKITLDDLSEEDFREMDEFYKAQGYGRPKPNWSSKQTFNCSLRLIYALGGKYRESSKENFHFIVSGDPERPLGIADSFVGQVLPGCIAKSPLQFVIGAKPTLGNVNVQARTLTIDCGYEVMEILSKFTYKYQLGKGFLFSISGKVCEADLENLKENGENEIYHLPYRETGYTFEGIAGILDSELEQVIVHSAIMIPDGKPPFDSKGGRLLRAVVSDERPLDLYIGEIIPERDITEERT